MPHFTKMAASQYDITPIEMAHASLIGQLVHILSPLVASTYLLVSMLEQIALEHLEAGLLLESGSSLNFMYSAASAILLRTYLFPPLSTLMSTMP